MRYQHSEISPYVINAFDVFEGQLLALHQQWFFYQGHDAFGEFRVLFPIILN